MNSEDQHARNLAELDRVRAHVNPRIERAERAYSQALTSLWIGNGGAALASLSFIGGTWQKFVSHRFLLIPLCFFVCGLVSMGIGAAVSLIREATVLDKMQRAVSRMDFKLEDIKTQTEQAGLTLDWRTVMALCSAALFVVGCIVGLIELWLPN